jgi:hypothetical protein
MTGLNLLLEIRRRMAFHFYLRHFALHLSYQLDTCWLLISHIEQAITAVQSVAYQGAFKRKLNNNHAKSRASRERKKSTKGASD